MGCGTRVAGALLLLVALVAAPVAAAKTSDSEAFASYVSEWTQDRTAILDQFFTAKYAQSASEKSTAILTVEKALTVTEKRLAKADVRKCFANYDSLVKEFVNALIRYFELVGPNPALAEAQYQYAGAIYPQFAASLEETIVACAGKAVPPVKENKA